MNKIYESIKNNLKKNIPDFKSGDTVAVGVKVIEGNRSRIQIFEGVVISISSGANILAAERWIEKNQPSVIVFTILCDRGERYTSILD